MEKYGREQRFQERIDWKLKIINTCTSNNRPNGVEVEEGVKAGY